MIEPTEYVKFGADHLKFGTRFNFSVVKYNHIYIFANVLLFVLCIISNVMSKCFYIP